MEGVVTEVEQQDTENVEQKTVTGKSPPQHSKTCPACIHPHVRVHTAAFRRSMGACVRILCADGPFGYYQILTR